MLKIDFASCVTIPVDYKMNTLFEQEVPTVARLGEIH